MTVEDLTLRHLRALRVQHEKDREVLVRLGELVSRLADRVGDTMSAVKDMDARMTNSFNEVRSDIVLLENQNISRHGEVLGILHRLDELEASAAPKPRRR